MCMARPNWSVHCLRQVLMRATQRAVLSLPAAIAGQNADPSSPLAAVPTAAAAGQRAADDRCRALLLPARHRQYRVHAAAQVQQVRQCSAAQRSAAAPRPAEPSLSPSLRCASACACFAVPYRAGAACASGSWRAGPMVSLCLLVNTADPLACIAGLPLSSYASCPAACCSQPGTPGSQAPSSLPRGGTPGPSALSFFALPQAQPRQLALSLLPAAPRPLPGRSQRSSTPTNAT